MGRWIGGKSDHDRASGQQRSLPRVMGLLRHQRALLRRKVLSRLGWASSPRNRHVLVERIMHRQVALGDGVGAIRFVLVDEIVHVRSKDVLRVLVDPLVVNLCPDEARTAGGAAADANACEQLKGRDDCHCEAPTADGLATQPCPEEARESGVQERDDAADTGQALDARETSASDSPCRPRSFGTPLFALGRLCSCSSTTSGTGPSTAACDDPVQDDDATQHTANCGVGCVWRTASHHWHGDGWRHGWQRCLRNPGQGAGDGFGGTGDTISHSGGSPSHRIGNLAEDTERSWHQGDKEENTHGCDARHADQEMLPKRRL